MRRLPSHRAWGEPDDEWIDDEDLAVQLNAYTAVAFEAELDDLDDMYAESGPGQRQVQRQGQARGESPEAKLSAATSP